MGDWQRTSNATADRVSQKTGRGSNTGLFQALVETAGGSNQSAKLIYQGGEQEASLPMPFESTSSWIRSIPESGSTALVGYRSDTMSPTFIRYIQDTPEKKLQTYRAKLNFYRSLNPGEHEIHSTGGAQTFYGSRPVLEHRGGVVRSWLNQDRAESGAKAPLHTRLLWDNLADTLGDEERFGVVRRSQDLNIFNTLLISAGILVDDPSLETALSLLLKPKLKSSHFYDYPFADFTLPGGLPALTAIAAKALDQASELKATITGDFKERSFAKEYLRVITNGSTLLPIPPVLVDIREGQVFDDDGTQVLDLSTGAYLRAKHTYYTSTLDSTEFTVDEIGNVSWSLSLGAITGFATKVPLGAWSLFAGLGVDIKTTKDFSVLTGLGVTMTTTKDISLESLVSTSMISGLEFSQKVGGTYAVQVGADASHTSGANFSITSGINTSVIAGTLCSLTAPIVQIGSAPVSPAVLGTELSTFLASFLNILISNASFFSIGNLGGAAPINPAVVGQLSSLLGTLPTVISKTITLGP